MQVRERPPLRLHVGLETPSGRHYRWAGDEPKPENVFSGLRHSSTMPGGYETCDGELPRKPGTDYGDMERLSTLHLYGAGGEKAGEYRLERAPKVSGDRLAISPSAVGLQAYLEDDKSVRAIYRDIDLSRWGSISAARRIALLAGTPWTIFDPSVAPDATSGFPAVTETIDGAFPAHALVEALYDAASVEIGDIYYDFARANTAIDPANANWQWSVGASDDDVLTNITTTGDLSTAGSGTGTLTADPDRRFAYIQFLYGAAGGTDGVQYEMHWRNLAVYGRHDLTLRGTEPDAGFWASDIVAHAVSGCPLLSFTEGPNGTIRPSSFIIPQLAFLESTTRGEIVRQATRFGLQDWAVWDDGTFWFHDRGAVGRRWRARISPAQLAETGPQIDRLWESIIVSYTDVDGSTRTVGPPGSGADTETAELKDSDPDNPANQRGIVRRDLLQMGTATVASATEVGRRFLEEQKLLDSSGQATLAGHVEDDRGVLHPYWKVKAGDYISFVDASDTSYRRIVKADHSYDSRSAAIDLDSPPEGLQAVLERLNVVLVPLGL